MADHPLIQFTNELMRLTDNLDQTTAADFVQRVYDAGRETGMKEKAIESPP
ncbi:hypothetical protein NLX86_05350 [Streptomyces sp. A3M-1-3]|uniref:hypothetical protein n=1 Tax=Streptomyces sp. A3M-1-3 TaxID=2962044 RepID=UPI0020B8ED3F|nr:hypothetical protein [Streptomyces sp. A3M-1-3]MCP3817581.1 hypothetical protein [Streptomyces sp. A3M-1-3]